MPPRIIKYNLLILSILMLVLTSCHGEVNVQKLYDRITAVQIITSVRDSGTRIERLIYFESLANQAKWLVGIQLPRNENFPITSLGTEFWLVTPESNSARRVGERFRHLHTLLLSPAKKSVIFEDGTGYADAGCIDLSVAIIRSFENEDSENLTLSDFDGLPTTDCSIYPWSSQYESWIPHFESSGVVYERPFRWLNENEIELLLGRLGYSKDGILIGKYVLTLSTRKARFVEALVTYIPEN